MLMDLVCALQAKLGETSCVHGLHLCSAAVGLCNFAWEKGPFVFFLRLLLNPVCFGWRLVIILALLTVRVTR